jgi:SAM-dependent methyltransferase
MPGTASRVAEVFGDNLPVYSMYGPKGAKLYHNFTLRDNAEVDELLGLAEAYRGSVLELACGSGRITLPFLAAGFDVVGLDSSPDMLALLRERLAEPDNIRLVEHLELVDGDMTSFELGRTFDIIVLGATAVWNLDAAQRADLFRCVREHLADGGRFLMTVLTFVGLEDLTAPIENISIFPAKIDDATMLCTFIDYVEPGGLRSTNILSHDIVDGTVTDTALYTAWSYLVTRAALTDEVEASGLHVLAQHEVTSRHQITRANTNSGRVRLLFEISR